MGGNLIKGVMREDLWCVEVVGGEMSRRAAAVNAQRAQATGPPQMGQHGCPWPPEVALEEGEGKQAGKGCVLAVFICVI
jgi:hypothetical protein